MFESRTVAVAVAAAVIALVVGFVLGRAVSRVPEAAAPPASPVVERPTAEEARGRAAEAVFKEAQIAGLTLRLGGGLTPFPKDLPVRQQPMAFYQTLRDARTACKIRMNLVGVECSEPPCIGLIRVVEGDVAAKVTGCPEWTAAFPGEPRVASVDVACPGDRVEGVVMVSPPAREAADAENARLQVRRDAVLAGWRCQHAAGDPHP